MRIKNGVRFVNPDVAMCHASMIIQGIYAERHLPCEITGGVEEHQHPSLHAYGAALDYGTRLLYREDSPEHREAKLYQLASAIRSALGDGFDVVLESDHLHVEYDPKS